MSRGWIALATVGFGCVSEPEPQGFAFAALDADAGSIACGEAPCTHRAAITGDDGLSAEIYLRGTTFHQGLNNFVVRLHQDASNEECALEQVYAVMSSHEHMSEPSRIDDVEPGYWVEDLALTMPGQLQMTLLADHRKNLEPLTFAIDVQ
ncbi:MAG TPA: hypothetical protein VHO25_13260 [Polyangiaceae bacterium]|nr:hypothetical protein [Polyangiaceae bacterium]